MESGFQQSQVLRKKPTKRGPRSIVLLTDNTMSEPLPRLPSEIVDYIIDFLHDDRNALKRCCLVSESWIPRARRHLFNEIELDEFSSLKAWGKLFPDPAKSPAYHVRSLVIFGLNVQVEGAEESGCIQSLINVTQSAVYGIENAKLKFFHNFSPVVKSLRVIAISGPLSNILALVCSFPLLEDLKYQNFEIINSIDQDGAAFRPSSSPLITGNLILEGCWLEAITVRMLDLPGGLRFRKIVWTGPGFWWMAASVERCSHTLEYIDIGFDLPREPRLFCSVAGSVSDLDFLTRGVICQKLPLTYLKRKNSKE